MKFAMYALAALLALIGLLPGNSAYAQTPVDAPAPHAPTPAAVEAFVDTFFAAKMDETGIPGAAFVLVQDGEIVLSKGYGYADLATKTLVDPDKTVFRVGSVSKLLTATAVMQQVESGHLDLDADVNSYLTQFRIDDSFAEPVTPAHLLTHTAGFDETFVQTMAPTAESMTTLDAYLAERMPARVRAPGIRYSYSNHGYTLAGHLVEQTSGLRFEKYVEGNILQPLGMEHSTFEQPLPPALKKNLARGYDITTGTPRPTPEFEYVRIVPAGALSATATDIAKFMIAHLQNGRFDEQRILREDTAARMHAQQFTPHSALPGIAYGFRESYENGQRAIWHSGAIRGYSSFMYLLPEQNLGFFVVHNAMTAELYEALRTQFLDRFYPQGSPATQPDRDFGVPVSAFVGIYRDIQTPRHNLDKVAAALGMLPQYTVRADTDAGTLTVDGATYKRIGPRLFRRAGDDHLIAFEVNAGSKARYLFFPGDTGPATLRRLAWYERPMVQLGLLVGSLLTFLSMVIAGAVRWVRDRRTGVWPKLAAPIRRIRRLSVLVAGLHLLFLFGFVLAVASDPMALGFGVPPVIAGLLFIPPVAGILSLVLLGGLVVTWARIDGLPAKLQSAMVVACTLAFLWQLTYWNLL